MKEELRHTLLNGEPDILKRVEKWHNEKIKSNNKQWFLAMMLVIIIFMGYTVIKHNYLPKQPRTNKDSVINYQALVIGIQRQALDSCVYFKDIK